MFRNDFTREDDEQLLQALRLRCSGASIADVSRTVAVGQHTLRDRLLAVRAADISHSGEPRHLVERGYWQ